MILNSGVKIRVKIIVIKKKNITILIVFQIVGIIKKDKPVE